MPAFSTEFNEEITASLHALISTSEDIYLRLGDEFPRLLREMDSSVEYSRELARNIKGESRSGSTGSKGSIDSAITATREIVAEGRKQFEQMRERDDELFSKLGASLDKLGTLGDHIYAIKEDSIEMELISLNAMTVALKAGSAGKAFSYITEELKRLSASTIKMTEQIEQHGLHLQDLFGSFRKDLEAAATDQREVFSGAADQLEESFDGFRKGLADIAGELERMGDEALTVKPPLRAIMEEVQLHDLVKQSVEHVIISLGELSQASDTATTEEALDELTFFEQMPVLCSRILDEVAERIRNSVTLFREKSAEAGSIIQSVGDQCTEFIDTYATGGQGEHSSYNSSNRSSDTASIDELYQTSSRILQNLLRDLRNSIQERQRIADQSRDLMKQVNRLNDDLRKFSVLVNRFRSVDIHSRIEVSKQEVLRQMSGTVDEMTELTVRIERHVNDSIADTTEFMKSASNVLNESRVVFEQESDYVKRFSRKINDSYHDLNEARSALVDAVGNYNAFTGRFLELFTEARGHHNDLEKLVQTIQQIKTQLRDVQQRAAREKQRLILESEYDSWSLESDRLKRIIERFTIFTHKAQAGEIGGFDIEQGAQSGEVTLF
ncbi:MAG: hypothetical protein ACOCRN_01910 [Spirochaetia bacterium]